jgi:mono/diheme cytochrome c family protein
MLNTLWRDKMLVSFRHLVVVISGMLAWGVYSPTWTNSKACAAEITFTTHIAKIMYEHCSACHRPGQAGPFSLLTYDDFRKHSETIQLVTKDRYMPPWKPVHVGIDFANDRRLSDEEIKLIATWVETDCPEGPRDQMPAAPQFTDGWALGTPDLIVKMPRPFKVPADGKDLYRSFVLPVGLPEDKWIKAYELRPTARNTVHHALFFVDETGSVRNQTERDGQPGLKGMNFLRGVGSNFLERGPDRLASGLGGYVPGAVPNPLPGDLARFLPKGSDIIMQTHFHPSGKPETEQAELGLYFADKPPAQQMVPIQLPPLFGMGAGLDIPAGEANFTIHGSYVLPIDVRAVEIGGHAHYICREMQLTAKLPKGESLELLKIDDWDLDWQDQYQFAAPQVLPKGTELSVTITYDNSAKNPENPFSPPQQIAWGRESTDEMGSITLQVIAVEESQREMLQDDLRKATRESLKKRIQSQSSGLAALGGGAIGKGGLVKLFDRNRDGKLQESEVPERLRERLFDFLDSNGDGELDSEELAAGRRNIEGIMERN